MTALSKLPVSKLIGATLLVSGTTIGAGMLALPVATGAAGFFPSMAMLILFWQFMTYTAFLLLEVRLWMPPETNLISMAKATFGKRGEIFSWGLYLFLLYSLTCAYIAGSAPIFSAFFSAILNIPLPEWVGWLPLLTIFGAFVYKGTRLVDLANRWLMLGMILSFALMAYVLLPYVKHEHLSYFAPEMLISSLSITATSFGFHIIIPSLTTYLKEDVSSLKKVLWLGGAIPLAVYLLWQYLALGSIPHAVLEKGFKEGANGAWLIATWLNTPELTYIALAFSLFAIVTSFLGVSLSLFDFLADGFNIPKTRQGRSLLYLLTFIPPLAFTIGNPRAFLSALEYAGSFGVILLLGLLPALMAWKGRYVLNFGKNAPYRAKGGKLALLGVIAFSFAVIAIEIYKKI